MPSTRANGIKWNDDSDNKLRWWWFKVDHIAVAAPSCRLWATLLIWTVGHVPVCPFSKWPFHLGFRLHLVWLLASAYPKWYFDRFSRFCQDHGHDPTDRPSCSICRNVLHSHVMQLNLINFFNQNREAEYCDGRVCNCKIHLQTGDIPVIWRRHQFAKCLLLCQLVLV